MAKVIDNPTEAEVITINLSEPKEKRKLAPAWKKPTEFFSSSLFFTQGKGEHDIILYLIQETQKILDKAGRHGTRGGKVDLAWRIKLKAKDNPHFKLGYRGTIELLQDYVDWQDMDGYKGTDNEIWSPGGFLDQASQTMTEGTKRNQERIINKRYCIPVKTNECKENKLMNQPANILSSLPEFIVGGETYEDINVDALDSLNITDLRNLAYAIGISLPMCKTDSELISEIRQKVETELAYSEYPIC